MQSLSQIKQDHLNSSRDIVLHHPTGRCWLPRIADVLIMQERTITWCEENQLLGKSLRTEETLAGLNPGLFSALVYPRADEAAAQLLSNFIAWWFLLDDELESRDVINPTTHKSSDQFRAYTAALAGKRPDGDLNSFITAALNIGRHLPELSTDMWHQRFCSSMQEWLFEGITRELICRQTKSEITTTQYLNIRHFSSGAIPTLYLGELAMTKKPGRLPSSSLVEPLMKQASRIIFLANDIFSFTKEQNDHSPFNLVLIIRNKLGGDLDKALTECAGHYNRAVTSYRQIRNELWEDDANREWLASIDDVLSGLTTWQTIAGRYDVANNWRPIFS